MGMALQEAIKHRSKACLGCKHLKVIRDGITNIHVCEKQKKYMSYDVVLIGRCEDYEGMTKEEIQEYVKNCPYSDKSIDSIHTCDLEFHYRKICPSPKCACATKFYGENSERE